MPRRKIILRTALFILFAGLCSRAIILWHYSRVTVPNGYAAWAAAALINEYTDAHQGAWPHNWDDLRQTYAHSNQHQRPPIDDIQSRVEINWNIDPHALAASPEPPRVVWLKDGSRLAFGVDPNALIWNHLRDKPKASDTETSDPASSK